MNQKAENEVFMKTRADHIHDYIKLIVAVFVVISAIVYSYRQISENKEDIEKTNVKVEEHEDDIHNLELNYKDMERLQETTKISMDNVARGVNNLSEAVAEQSKMMNEQKTNIAVIREKVEDLERAE